MGSAVQTTDHATIRTWAEARGGHPAQVKGTRDRAEGGVLRIDFGAPEPEFEAIDWEDFFATFEARGLALLYQDEPESRFNKLVDREGGNGR